MDTLNSLGFFSTEIILSIAAVAILLVDAFTPTPIGYPKDIRPSIGVGVTNKKHIAGYICLFSLCLGGVYLLPVLHYPLPVSLFFNMVTLDSFGIFFKILILAATALVVLLSFAYRGFSPKDSGAYYSLLLFSAVGLSLMASATNLLMLYLSIEMVSLISYLLVGYLKKDKSSSEGGLKYFLFGAASTGIMLYGISLIFGITGTLDITECGLRIAEFNEKSSILSGIGLIFILVGVGFKIALVPFHMWAPDAYEGAPTPITAFLSVGPKAAGFALLLRLIHSGLQMEGLLETLTILTMTVGNIIAISQSNIKRMLAYSSIAQAGYILIGFVAGTLRGTEGVLIYLIAYLLMNIGAFGIVIAISNALKTDKIEDYAGLSRHSGGLALCLTLFLLSLAGIPPLAGFIGKFYVFSAAIESGMIGLAIAGVINSVIALYYYVKVIRYMYFVEPIPERPATISKPFSLKLALGISVAGTLIIGIMPASIIEWILRVVYRL